MHFHIVRPPKHLSEIVRCFWMFECDPESFKPRIFQSMADGYAELIFAYNGGFEETKRTPFYVRTAKLKVEQFTLLPRAGMFGVRLFPNAFSELLGIPASELIDGVHDVQAIFGKLANDLQDQLADASFAERIELMSNFISRLMLDRDVDPMRMIVKKIISDEGQVNIKELQIKSGYSERQFERRFKACAGFSPKQLARIIRFQTTKQKYATGNFRNLAELAVAANYCDQSHFIRDFKEFSGLHPRKYFRIFDDSEGDESRVLKGLVLGKDRE